jgi:DNA polymerase I
MLSSLLNLRIETKRLKKTNPDYKGIDSVLKWMLVTCLGYTGYRNAKFGQIQVHERITVTSRELLMAKIPRRWPRTWATRSYMASWTAFGS